ncbi:putative membrane-bound dehydrogenase-like protein [Roseimicrobium gellanilyticum]|uniref:Putative membrane-bound dehydrogenase-like protein n=1 Tax=Roseimicrobium gellanilyticum TaxID=748857 RepID=A0A366HRH4_9BACT|nr:PVC-type heme-binding CxxCH protein [Roseimicrobium gellanilyticum]RBP45152.1 putative membrane-bound dehydrogenase-like protein [Roseimicrobium gellanilyticum]
MPHRVLAFLAALHLGAAGDLAAADLKPDESKTIPADAIRPVVVSADAAAVAGMKSQAPKATLPEGWELVTAAAAPLVTHPIMGCLDDKGRLFLGDAVGLNWNKKRLEENPPNRVLMLEDADHDGVFEKSTVFADKLTFPQGAVWLKGSLYVASPPGIWKLTDADGNGVAEQREMIVGGFEYTGNAADVHGPFLHPNGRLYWCHGRKGHKVAQKDGTLVHEGLASGIWSCEPDGGDVRWHSLGCADNPTEIDFTPSGDIIGTCNLYYSQPRGDTLMHWLQGGVYERADMMKAIEGLPRTLEHMPVIHNFGHVAVSGCVISKSGLFDPKNSTVEQQAGLLSMFVTHFNTQRVVRMELLPHGVTYKATEHEFLRLPDSPDVHFTDVIEDELGDLLVLDTGGWFRIGCPSSLMAKPEAKGAVYRVRRKDVKGGLAKVVNTLKFWKESWEIRDENEALKQLTGNQNARAKVQACQWIAEHPGKNPQVRDAVLKLLDSAVEPALEHAIMHAAQALFAKGGLPPIDTRNELLASRLLVLASQGENQADAAASLLSAARNVNAAGDSGLANAIRRTACAMPNGGEVMLPVMQKWLEESPASEMKLQMAAEIIEAHFKEVPVQDFVAAMLGSAQVSVRRVAWHILSTQTTGITNEKWLEPLEKSLAEAGSSDLGLLIEAVTRLKSDRFNVVLQAMVNDPKRPQSIRLKALSATSRGSKILSPEGFALLTQLLGDVTNVTARIEAARVLATVPLMKEQLLQLAGTIPTLGPLELQEMLKLVRKTKDADTIKALASSFAQSPVVGAIEESAFKTAFANSLPEAYDLVAPAIRQAAALTDAKKRKLASLASEVQTQGRAEEGKKHFATGKGTCLACHKVGEVGRALGPDLTKIGAIRTERDLLESIMFPSNTLARDYEAHAIETSDGQSLMGLIRSHTAEGLLLVDLAGQEKSVPHASIVANTTLTTSLMPMGLDGTMTEQELCDLVAWLRSLK